MDKKTRFKPASFLEVDDLYGGRKVVMVGADGITFWDALDVETVTPIVIHPIFKPVEIGPLIYNQAVADVQELPLAYRSALGLVADLRAYSGIRHREAVPGDEALVLGREVAAGLAAAVAEPRPHGTLEVCAGHGGAPSVSRCLRGG